METFEKLPTNWFMVGVGTVLFSILALTILGSVTTRFRSELSIAQDSNIKEFLTERYSARYAEMVDLNSCKQLCAPTDLEAGDQIVYIKWLKNKKEVTDGK